MHLEHLPHIANLGIAYTTSENIFVEARLSFAGCGCSLIQCAQHARDSGTASIHEILDPAGCLELRTENLTRKREQKWLWQISERKHSFPPHFCLFSESSTANFRITLARSPSAIRELSRNSLSRKLAGNFDRCSSTIALRQWYCDEPGPYVRRAFRRLTLS